MAGPGHVAIEGIGAGGAQGCHRKERGTLQSCIAVAAVLLVHHPKSGEKMNFM
jgi:hypothetical protein